MTSALQLYLIIHVLTGITGTICLYVIWMGLLKEKVNTKYLLNVSRLGVIAFFVSWYTAAEYYVDYYGKAVKPAILAGPYSWAHLIMMEAKEHIFLFLPFLAIVLALSLWALGDLDHESPAKRGLATVAGAATILGVIITLAGVLISGGVR